MDLRSRVYENVKRRLQDRAIAVDCEYHSTPSGKIDRIYCICACRADHSIFFNQAFARGGRCATLNEIADFLSVKDPIFICHALEIAERRAFLATGDRPDDHAWIDTFTLSQATENAACTGSSAQHSLVALCQKYLNVSIDSAAKEYMRRLCIDDCTEGHEIELLSYCREDVAHLHELAYRLITEHAIALHTSLHIGAYEKKDMIKRALDMTRSAIEFAQIADRGLPVCADRIERLQQNAPKYLDKKIKEISCKYPGLYRIERGKKIQDKNSVQKYMKECIDTEGVFDYPRTSSGCLSTDAKDLARFFGKQHGCFASDLLELSKSTARLRGVTGKNSWLKNYDPEQKRIYYGSMRPYCATSGRCAPQPSDGFIPAWDKALQGLLDPPEGKWLVELDYKAEETFIQAAIYNDQELMRVYQSKDIYLYYCTLAGVIPVREFSELPQDELKEKYREIRAKFKTLILGNSYGAGAPRLAEASGLSVEDAGKIKVKIDRALCASVQAKAEIQRKLSAARGLAFPDGWIIRTRPSGAVGAPSPLTVGNAPIQGMGAVILRAVVHALCEDPRTRDRALIVATMHDAVWLEITEGDNDVITTASEIMRTTADRLCGADGMRVGEPQIIRHGELWTPDHAHDADFCELCAKD